MLNQSLLKIDPQDLVDMHSPLWAAFLKCKPAYAQEDNQLFGERIYKPDAKIILHKDLASVIVEAARTYHKETEGAFLLYDGLRTVDAQEAMLKTRRAQENPQWMEPPAMLSTPGMGAHPRGMAIDVTLLDAQGMALDMGTPFDALAQNAAPEYNPAHRQHPHLPATVQDNRSRLSRHIFAAASRLNVSVEGLDVEWWDYRLPASFYNRYAPLCDADLPPAFRQMS